MIPARQSTAFELSVGPVLDADGVAVTDCVVGDFKAKKTTGNYAALNGSATLTHVSAGTYDLVLTTSDTDTVGLLTISIDDTVNACAPVRIQVIEEAIYDALFAASANAFTGAAGSTTLTALASGSITAAVIATDAIDADAIADNAINAAAIATGAITAAKFAAGAIDAAAIADAAIDAATFAADVDAEILSYLVDDAARIDASALNTAAVTTIPTINTAVGGLQTTLQGLVLYSGTIGSTGNDTTHVHLEIPAGVANDDINGLVVVLFDNSLGVYNVRYITDWVAATQLATLDSALPASPQNATDGYWILSADLGRIYTRLGAPAGASMSADIAAVQSDTNDIQTRIPAALVGGRIDATVDGTGMESGAINAIIEAAFTYNATADYASADAGSLVKQIADNAGGSVLTTDAICEAMFTFDATATYGTANAGSVVKQIADNAGGSALTEAGIADAVWDEARSGHVTAGTFGEYVLADATRISGDATAADNAEAFFDGTGYAGTNNVIPTVTTVGTVNALAANSVNASALASDAVTEIWAGSTAPSAATIADAVWDEDATAHQTQGSFGQAIGDPGSDSDTIWSLANTNLDAAVSSRMATYTQPTGFLAATFPTTVASTTNITAGTITTATNVTTVNGLAAGVITAASIATGAIDADALAADAVDEFWDEAIGDSTITARQALRLFVASLAGKLSGAATTTVTIRNAADSQNVIVATVDADGNRSAVTLTP